MENGHEPIHSGSIVKNKSWLLRFLVALVLSAPENSNLLIWCSGILPDLGAREGEPELDEQTPTERIDGGGMFILSYFRTFNFCTPQHSTAQRGRAVDDPVQTQPDGGRKALFVFAAVIGGPGCIASWGRSLEPRIRSTSLDRVPGYLMRVLRVCAVERVAFLSLPFSCRCGELYVFTFK